ncbi:glycosyltransferase [Terrabacter carboxydivorans]|uniref:Glycosyl transferase family 28 C-terminal domain-containing protein n=1 Tax=Terrabacter carboxydivorans TaxID=619730 RepID=A0ABN3KMN2_9MICO
MIGYYVHHQGLGHLTRLQALAEQLRSPVTGLSSLPRPAGWDGDWVQLDRDDALPAADAAAADATALGVLHWAPRHDRGLAGRGAAVAEWIRRTDPALVVVDVSVEIAVLSRLCGVPVVVLAMPGVRTDRPHALAYDLAEALLAPWPDGAHTDGWPAAWHAKLWAVGGLSRFDGRAPGRVAVPEGALPDGPGAPGRPRRVLLLWGGGGRGTSAAEVAAARAATPGWEWVERGPGSPSPDLWSDLASADVVVTHGGQNSVAEVAAAGRPAVVVAQPRPFDEQVATARAVERLGAAVGVDTWPRAESWPGLLDRAVARGGEGWRRWSTGNGAAVAAARLDALVDRHRRSMERAAS